VLISKLVKRNVDSGALDFQDVEGQLKNTRQNVNLKQGLDADSGRKINKLIKEGKFKVTTQMQDKQLRVTGKKRDDLQLVMAMLRGADIGVPVQFTNFRD
jgi:uncharacterized protein YajQ (UPF0234 family)